MDHLPCETISDIRMTWLLKLKPFGAVLGGLLVTLAIGNYQTFGNMAPYAVSYIRDRGYPENLTYMVFQTAYALILIIETPSMILSGYLDKVLGLRLVVMLACFVYCLGYLLTAIALDLNFLLVFLFSGAFGGFAVGLTFNTIGGNAASWFPDHRATASAISTGGFSLAPVIFAPIQTAIVNPKNMVANTTSTNSAELYFSQDDLLSRVPLSYIVVSLAMATASLTGILLLFDPREEENYPHVANEEISTRQSGAYVILRSKAYWILVTSMCFMNQYPVFMMMNFKAFGQIHIHDDSLLTFIGCSSSLTAAAGRALYGLLLDRTSIKVSIFVSSVTQIISMLILGLTTAYKDSLVYTLIVHIAAINIGSVVIVFQDGSWKAFGSRNRGLSVGLVNIGYSASVVCCVLIGIVAIERNSWTGIFLFLSITPVLGFLVIIFLDETDRSSESGEENHPLVTPKEALSRGHTEQSPCRASRLLGSPCD